MRNAAHNQSMPNLGPALQHRHRNSSCSDDSIDGSVADLHVCRSLKAKGIAIGSDEDDAVSSNGTSRRALHTPQMVAMSTATSMPLLTICNQDDRNLASGEPSTFLSDKLPKCSIRFQFFPVSF